MKECWKNRSMTPGWIPAADTRRFYSYRMEKGQTGRMLALFGPDHATRPHQIII